MARTQTGARAIHSHEAEGPNGRVTIDWTEADHITALGQGWYLTHDEGTIVGDIEDRGGRFADDAAAQDAVCRNATRGCQTSIKAMVFDSLAAARTWIDRLTETTEIPDPMAAGDQTGAEVADALAPRQETRDEVLAAIRAQMAPHRQYEGHFDTWLLARVRHAYSTKMGLAFVAEELTLVEQAGGTPRSMTGPQNPTYAAFSRRNGVTTWIPAAFVEVLEGTS